MSIRSRTLDPARTLTYDLDGRVKETTDALGQVTTIDYDANGNPDTMTDPRGMTTITYDAQNRPTLITAPSGRQHDLTHDNAGNVTGQRVHRSTSTGQKLIKSTKRFFDAENRLYASYTRDAQGKLLASLSYSYDENGNPTQRQTGSSDQRFAYDVVDRIKQVAFASGKRSGQADTYTYDAAGNRSTKNGQPYAYNALGQITSAPGGVTFAYDPQGRRTAKSTPAGSQTYRWDAFDQLTQSTSTDGMATTYAHDALGRLTAETAAAFTRTYNHQAGDSPSAITSTQTGPESSLTRTQRLTYGPGGLIESQLGSAAPTYPEADNVGTITAWTDEQGSVTQEPELDPFGELVGPRPNSTPSPVDQSPLTLTGAFGRQSLAGADLVKMGARAYDPELGAFISRDPVTGDPSEPARRAAYAYAFNGPGRYLDLDGRSVVGWSNGTERAQADYWTKMVMSGLAGHTDPNAFSTELSRLTQPISDLPRRVLDSVSRAAPYLSPDFGEQCGRSYWSRARSNFAVTNTTVIGFLSPTGTGLITGSRFAQSVGELPLLEYVLRTIESPGQIRTLIKASPRIVITSAGNFLIVGLTWETGVGLGSLVSAAYSCGCGRE